MKNGMHGISSVHILWTVGIKPEEIVVGETVAECDDIPEIDRSRCHRHPKK
ncbi:hypothetical protein DAMNIGENAA_11590 [Desulforhabdus amnigena]|uniref:Uncharacterized protein n=1 Tax=Desulforhabdus amnigena TaxID=40218 RepID=A0A9W6FTN4_9BACT|nr:hypothetical protein DAMNIGENAA_11590 [Desulforhabdus amnigena]